MTLRQQDLRNLPKVLHSGDQGGSRTRVYEALVRRPINCDTMQLTNYRTAKMQQTYTQATDLGFIHGLCGNLYSAPGLILDMDLLPLL